MAGQVQFRDELILMATYLVTALRTCPPRTISTIDCKIPIMIFTDGAHEPDLGEFSGSAGLVIVDYSTGLKLLQVVDVSQDLLEHWKRFGSKQLVAYLELWPVVACLFN